MCDVITIMISGVLTLLTTIKTLYDWSLRQNQLFCCNNNIRMRCRIVPAGGDTITANMWITNTNSKEEKANIPFSKSSSITFSVAVLLYQHCQLDIMDVLRPSLININGRIYRRNIIKEEQYEDEEDFSYMDAPG